MKAVNKDLTKNLLKHLCDEYLLDIYFTHYGLEMELCNCLFDNGEHRNGYVISVSYEGITLHFLIYSNGKVWCADLIFQDNNESIKKFITSDALNKLIMCLKNKIDENISLKKEVYLRKERLLECKLYEQRLEDGF